MDAEQKKELLDNLEKIDQQLSGIQYYSDCKTARLEAGDARKKLRAEIMKLVIG